MKKLSSFLVLTSLLFAACQPGPLLEPEAGPGFKEVQMQSDKAILVNLCPGTPMKLSATIPGASAYLWSTGETTSTITVSDSGIYMVEISTGSGIDSAVAFVNPANEAYVFPTYFSPDNSGINDIYQIESSCIFSLSLRILDPVNDLIVIYETKDKNFEWDGTKKNGKLVPPQTYQVIYKGSLYSGEMIEGSYWIELVY